MPELLLELLSEEIPARMQARAAADLSRLLSEALAPLTPIAVRTFAGPRRIALTATVAAELPAQTTVERGPRTSAPETALAGFLRKHAATRDQLVAEGDFWVLHKQSPATSAATLIAQAIPALIRRFPWPKSMRWGTGSALLWVRPLRRILCILDGETVPFFLADNADTGHRLASDNQTEGHRFHSPGPVAVTSAADWQNTLRARHVLADAADRRARIETGFADLAAAQGLRLVPDDALLDEIAGLVEWPVPLLGRIDAAYMDLPAEVMQVSMRVNQRYAALQNPDGSPAPFFAFAANVEAHDAGATIIAGNERVLRARFSDARHFWDTDRRTPLADRLADLDRITFHAKLGSQGARARRLERLAAAIAPYVGADPARAARAALLAKADLTTGMVGEFPELQGIMGGYYAAGEGPDIAAAIATHYAPKGPTDPVPTEPVAIAVALADKIDQLCAFFALGEIPTGSGDPFALRRAALGIIRIVRENALRLPLRRLFHEAEPGLPREVPTGPLLDFIADRLRVQLRAEGKRHDVLAAVFGAAPDDDLVRLLARTDALAAFLQTPDGANLLAAARRAANILRIEDKKDGPHRGAVDPALLRLRPETDLAAALTRTETALADLLPRENFVDGMSELARLRPVLDPFFDEVTVNAPDPALRENRLRLLSRIGAAMALAADFSRIEG
ncbi:MAG: glycine--tRNA ligase subunit beta [Acetobacteraceae bacterium]|nr:glycine--tRNA ligase subunit beta [Acetobacteraceae bacterium]